MSMEGSREPCLAVRATDPLRNQGFALTASGRTASAYRSPASSVPRGSPTARVEPMPLKCTGPQRLAPGSRSKIVAQLLP